MKPITILLLSFLLNGCFLFMHKCDSLSGWCYISKTSGLQEYNFWETKKETDNLKNNVTLTLSPTEREEENNKKKIILEKCHIDPYSGKLLGNTSKNEAYKCVYGKGLTR